MRVLFVRCSIRYSGRIDAELGLGDRLILVKDDGAVVVHATHGLSARNWMPAGSVWEELSPTHWCVRFPARAEQLDIWVEHLFSDVSHSAGMDGALVKLGSEREMSDLLARQLWRFGGGVTLIAREHMTRVGPIDILAQDSAGLVIVEVKRARAVGVEIAYQLLRYRDALAADPLYEGIHMRCVLVAPGMSRPLLARCEQLDMEIIRVSYADLLGVQSPSGDRTTDG